MAKVKGSTLINVCRADMDALREEIRRLRLLLEERNSEIRQLKEKHYVHRLI